MTPEQSAAVFQAVGGLDVIIRRLERMVKTNMTLDRETRADIEETRAGLVKIAAKLEKTQDGGR